MSFETVITISAITEVIAISAICLTLANAFSDGALARLVFGQKKQAERSVASVERSHNDDQPYLRAA
ncbi:MAG: hypothetical protein V3S07_00910 [Micropepsaceae bacterium]